MPLDHVQGVLIRWILLKITVPAIKHSLKGPRPNRPRRIVEAAIEARAHIVNEEHHDKHQVHQQTALQVKNGKLQHSIRVIATITQQLDGLHKIDSTVILLGMVHHLYKRLQSPGSGA